jgi:hypothetical protein
MHVRLGRRPAYARRPGGYLRAARAVRLSTSERELGPSISSGVAEHRSTRALVGPTPVASRTVIRSLDAPRASERAPRSGGGDPPRASPLDGERDLRASDSSESTAHGDGACASRRSPRLIPDEAGKTRRGLAVARSSVAPTRSTARPELSVSAPSQQPATAFDRATRSSPSRRHDGSRLLEAGRAGLAGSSSRRLDRDGRAVDLSRSRPRDEIDTPPQGQLACGGALPPGGRARPCAGRRAGRGSPRRRSGRACRCRPSACQARIPARSDRRREQSETERRQARAVLERGSSSVRIDGCSAAAPQSR